MMVHLSVAMDLVVAVVPAAIVVQQVDRRIACRYVQNPIYSSSHNELFASYNTHFLMSHCILIQRAFNDILSRNGQLTAADPQQPGDTPPNNSDFNIMDK